MARLIGGVIVGYLVMFVVVFASFSGAFLAMGADAAFRPGTYDVSILWILVSFTLGLVAAVAGGWVAAAIGGPKAVTILAGLALVLGLLLAIPALTSPPPAQARLRDPGGTAGGPLGEVGNLAAMQNAQTPGWIALLNPLVGAAGVMIGGRLKR